MRSSIPIWLAAALAVAAPGPAAATLRVPGKAKLVASSPYPPEAKKKNIEGNVVLSGEVTPQGKVAALRVLASSSKLLDAGAQAYVSRWTFGPPLENGKPIPISLNVVVRFRKDKSKTNEPGSLPAPIVGNLVIFPVPRRGDGNPGDEGFPVEPDDRGVRGLLDVDFPASLAAKPYKVDVTDVGPTGKTTLLLGKTVQAGGQGRSTISFSFSRNIRAADKAEKGLHSVRVAVDGANAGGAQYRVGPAKS